MPELFAGFLPLIVVAYIVTIGFGMILGQSRGASAVNRFWMRSIRSIARGIFRLIAKLFNSIANLF